MDKVDYGEFSKLELRVGEIIEVEENPNADKLFVMKVNLGEENLRTIVAGLKGYYSEDELKGKKAIFVANLKPVKLRGVESNGMILAAVTENEEEVKILVVDGDIAVGTRVS